MTKLHVKKGDTVLVIAGKDKGKTGKITTAIPSDNAVIVEGVNFIHRHTKAKSAQEKSSIVKTEGKIDVSNVQIICGSCGKATRIANKEIDGKHVRVCKHCGVSLDQEFKKATKKASKKATTAEEKPAKKAETKKVTASETKKVAPKSTVKKTGTTAKTTTRKTQAKVSKGGTANG